MNFFLTSVAKYYPHTVVTGVLAQLAFWCCNFSLCPDLFIHLHHVIEAKKKSHINEETLSLPLRQRPALSRYGCEQGTGGSRSANDRSDNDSRPKRSFRWPKIKSRCAYRAHPNLPLPQLASSFLRHPSSQLRGPPCLIGSIPFEALSAGLRTLALYLNLWFVPRYFGGCHL